MINPVENQIHNRENERNENRRYLIAHLPAVTRGREVDGQDVQGDGEHNEKHDDKKDGDGASEARKAAQGCRRGGHHTTAGRVVVRLKNNN